MYDEDNASGDKDDMSPSAVCNSIRLGNPAQEALNEILSLS